MTEFRFSPIKLPDPPSDRVVERARSRSSCCGNCDQGLPCASKAGSCSTGRAPHDDRAPRREKSCGDHDAGMPPERAPGRPSFQAGETCAVPRLVPVSPLPLAAEPLPGGDPKPPFWKPTDIEVKLDPMLECYIPETGEWSKAPGSQGYELKPQATRETRPVGSCGPVPFDPDDYPTILTSDRRRCALDACIDQTARCAPINAKPYSPQSRAQAVFSYSKWKNGLLEDGGADCSIIRAIARHIDTTRAGDEVLIAISAWWVDGWPIAKAVQYASERGVNVRVITGGGAQEKWYHTSPWIYDLLKKSIGEKNIKLWVGAKSFPNISHNKFVLIRKAPSEHLVLIGGANWGPFDIARNCDLLTVNSDTIWAAFRVYWNSLWTAPFDGPAQPYWPEAADPITGVTAHFWPILTMDGDPAPDGWTSDKNPFYQIISKYKKDKTTKIRIITANWLTTDEVDPEGPGSDLLDLLKEYRDEGSDVRVIGTHHLDVGCASNHKCEFQPYDNIAKQSCETRWLVWRRLQDYHIPWAKCGTHAKILLVSGVRIADNKSHHSVYTGTMNASYEINMPDAFIGVHDDPAIFAQYEEWWQWLCVNNAMNRGGSNSVCGPFKAPLPTK